MLYLLEKVTEGALSLEVCLISSENVTKIFIHACMYAYMNICANYNIMWIAAKGGVHKLVYHALCV